MLKKLMFKLFGGALTLGILLLASSPASALPLCTSANLNTLLTGAAASPSCYLGDKVFSNFTYTPEAGGTAASSIKVDFSTGDSEDTPYGLSLQPITSWQLGFTFGFTVSVCHSSVLCGDGAALGGGSAITWIRVQGDHGTKTPGLLVTDAVANSTNYDLDTQAGHPDAAQAFLGAPAQSVTFTTTWNAANSLKSVEYDVQQSPVPEPVSMALAGLGLVALGILGRKRLVR